MGKYAESSDKKFAEDVLKGAPLPGKAWLDFERNNWG